MTLSKAIRVLKDLDEFGVDEGYVETHIAIRLGIEAMEAYKKLRHGKPNNLAPPLPGETRI